MLKIDDAIREILKNAAKGKSGVPQALSAYQIADRLPEDLFDQLERDHGREGTQSMFHIIALKCVGLAHNAEADITYADARGMAFEVKHRVQTPKYQVIAFYRAA